MAVLDKTDLAREEIEAFNQGDWERFRQVLSDDSVLEELATQRRFQGADDIVEANQGWKRAFPDATGTVTTATESDDSVTLEITWEGTQSGALETPRGELPPSNRHVVVKAAQVFKFDGDKIAEAHHYFDMMGLLEQIADE